MNLRGALVEVETTVVTDAEHGLDGPSGKYLAYLYLLAVVAFSGSLIGPIVGGLYGYEVAYLCGWFGPLALVILALSLFPIAWKHGWV